MSAAVSLSPALGFETRCDNFRHIRSSSSMMALPMTFAVSMRILQKKCFECQVPGKCNHSYAKAWESSLESIPSRERACSSPALSVHW